MDRVAFEMGWWSQWLRSIQEGEEIKEPISEKRIRSARAVISKLRAEDLYFKTSYKDGHLTIKRVPLEEWVQASGRKIW